MYIIVISDVESQCQTRRYIPDPSLKGETTNIVYANTLLHGHDADCGLDGCYYFYIWRSCGNLEFRVKTRHFKMKISSRGAALDPKLAKGAPPPFGL